MSYRCAYHDQDHEGEPFQTVTYICAQHGVEIMDYCERGATWLGANAGEWIIE